MNYKIIVDSCCDLTEEMKKWDNLVVIPLTLQIGDYSILDDKNFNQDDFIGRVKSSKDLPKSACPSPDAFAKACEGEEENIYIMTITDKLSGCYNSALQGVTLFKEDNPDSNKNIHVFNSLATSGLETIVAGKIKELTDKETPFEEVCETVDKYIVENCSLYFCLESLDALKGNGRLFNLAAKVIEALKVKLICRRTEYGNIEVVGKDLSVTRAMGKIASHIAKEVDGVDLSDKTIIISHVCCEEKSNTLMNVISQKADFGNKIVLKCSGLNSLYASDGGIIVSFNK